ncbi:PucR family transcriptional regulator [Salisediminibacterium selenitireducens]|uniref:Transcriptional regulator, CdaR n=1 Tax=Bacillus selenitireducens (strain ATCC 700615 / DSM 15326 / MLS10) TaxID=439292 RepID=D6XU76_BACIE|nr:helix-turn-helix domain-containing protein [Salisediminibacterium selenitireducens]ADH99362.1 transcriptional regulator, CdaR [[Bacillus] selenitireducens MLS10]
MVSHSMFNNPELQESFRHQLLRALSSGKGIQAILYEFYQVFSIRAVITDDIFYPQAIKSGQESDRYIELIDVIDGEPAIILDRRLQYQWQAVRFDLKSNDEICGYLFVDEIGMTNFIYEQIKSITGDLSFAVLAELKKNKELLHQGRRWKYAFLFDLLYGNIKDEQTLNAHAKTWEWDLSVPHMVLSFQLQNYDQLLGDEVLLEKIQRTWELFLMRHLINPMILQKRDELIVCLPVDSNIKDLKNSIKVKERVNQLLTSAATILNQRDFYIGAGRAYHQGIELYRSYQEAKMARNIGIHETGEKLSFFHDIGLMKLLYSHDRSELHEFYKDTMGELLNHDDDTEAELKKALRTYIEQDLDISRTAHSLFVHKNTVRYRLKKIEDLLHVDLSDLSVIMDFAVAFHIETLHQVDRTKLRRW